MDKNHVTDRPDVLGFDDEDDSMSEYIFDTLNKPYTEASIERRKIKSETTPAKPKLSKRYSF